VRVNNDGTIAAHYVDVEPGYGPRYCAGTRESVLRPLAVNKRAKGLAAEREVADIWKFYDLEVRNLEMAGDHLVIGAKRTIHSEVKRQERMKLWEWLKQAEIEAPFGAVPVVAFRRNRGNWYACLPLEDLAELVTR